MEIIITPLALVYRENGDSSGMANSLLITCALYLHWLPVEIFYLHTVY